MLNWIKIVSISVAAYVLLSGCGPSRAEINSAVQNISEDLKQYCGKSEEKIDEMLEFISCVMYAIDEGKSLSKCQPPQSPDGGTPD